jgi:hypothetical protein
MTHGLYPKWRESFNYVYQRPSTGLTNARAHLAWGSTRQVRQTAQSRLKIGARREGTVSDDLLESRRLTRTDGGDLAYICSGARRGAISYPKNPITTILQIS